MMNRNKSFIDWLPGCLAALAAVLVLLLVGGGCRRPGGNTQQPAAAQQTKAPARETDPSALLAKVRRVYADAEAYQDDGQVQWERLNQVGQWEAVAAPLSTAFRRPGQLGLRCRDLTLALNDGELRARIKDPPTKNLDGQVVVREVKSLSVREFDPARFSITSEEFYKPLEGGPSLPLLMLMRSPDLDKLFAANTAKLLDDGEIDGKKYQRLEVQGLIDYRERDLPPRRAESDPSSTTSPDNNIDTEEDVVVDVQLPGQGEQPSGPIYMRRILWIDPATHLLRRVGFPDIGQRDFSKPEEPLLPLRNVVVELPGATINGPLDESRFALDVSSASHRVPYFVALPPELPSPLFGSVVEDFSVGSEGESVTRDGLRGQPAVLVWFLPNDISGAVLKQLDQVRSKYGKKANFFAISVVPRRESGRVQRYFKNNQIGLPVVYDDTQVGDTLFKVPGAPCVIVLDGDSKMQAFSPAHHPEVHAQLPLLLDKLLAGEDPAAFDRREIERQQASYAKELAIAKDGAGAMVVPLVQTKIAPASKPETLHLRPRWRTEEIKRPGNVLIVPTDDGPPRILVQDMTEDLRTIAELDLKGQLVQRHKLPAPKNAAIAYLRTAVDHQGKRYFAGSARLAQQAFLFDEDFKLLAAYPDGGQEHDGISDVALVDFDGEGNVQMVVGFWGVQGVHGVGLDGERKWSNRTVSPVVSLATAPANELGTRLVLATNDRGDIAPINRFGNHDPVTQVSGLAVMQLFSSAGVDSRPSPYLGVALQQGGGQQAVALNESLKYQWSMNIPHGNHRTEIQWVQSAPLLHSERMDWILAGPDGSVGIVSDNSQFADMFHYGAELTGVAATRVDGQGVLVLATNGRVTAWDVSPPTAPLAPQP